MMVERKHCARELEFYSKVFHAGANSDGIHNILFVDDNSEDYLKLDDFNGVDVLLLDECYFLRTTKYNEHILYSLLSFLVHFGVLNLK